MKRATRTRLAALGAVVVTVMVATSGAVPVEADQGKGWTVTKTRTYSGGDVGPLLGGTSTGGCGWGTVCFGGTVGDHFTVTVEDDSGRPVGGVVQIRGATVTSRPFCGTTGRLRVVSGDLRVYLDAPGDVRDLHWYNGPGCREIEPVGATWGATSGRVRVTFTGSPSAA